MANNLSAKRITDPIYGTIELSELEAKLVSTKAFQRLHNVKQLGLGYLVFPSANYSRFSHSVGAAFNARRIMEAINRNRGRTEFSDREMQLYRVAALFHDLGHYPFSHTTEHAVGDFYSEQLFADGAGSDGQAAFTKSGFGHEKLGEKILELDPEIIAILAEEDLSPGDVKDIFLDLGRKTIISSDLDCDRLDYLGRTAHHSGAPYGSVDVDFIIGQATLDLDRRFCFGYKSLRAVDHLLVSRFFDFAQIPFHKTVAALEWSLEVAVKACLARSLLGYSQDELVAEIESGTWWLNDEPHLLGVLRTLFSSLGTADGVLRDHLRAVLARDAAKQIIVVEQFVPEGEKKKAAKDVCQEIASHLSKISGVESGRLHVWSPKFKYAKSSPVSGRKPRDLSDEEKYDLIHVLPQAARKSVPLVSLPSSLANQLAPTRYEIARVYYLPREGDSADFIKSLRASAAAA